MPGCRVLKAGAAANGLYLEIDAGLRFDHPPIIAALAYRLFYNFRATRSATLAFSTSMLQRLAALGPLFLYFRWEGDRVNRRH
jgi:hypothetical protein